MGAAPGPWGGLWASLRELCFPPVCLLCGTGLPAFSEIHLCPGCWGGVQPIRPPLCLCCGVEFAGAGENHLCGDCLTRPPQFGKARAVLRYTQDCGRLVHGFKYGGRTVARRTFQALARESGVLEELTPPDLVLAVPLHRRRLRHRGFNQALVLARFLLDGTGWTIHPDLLRRCRWTEPQVSLSGRERRQNLKGAFQVQRPELVQGRGILLVDDVFTTGTTLNECARTLRAAGASQVEALTLARVVPGGQGGRQTDGT